MNNQHNRTAAPPRDGEGPHRALLHRLTMGYRVVFRSLLALVALVGATAAVAVVIVFPLWYGAKNAPQLYSTGVVTILAALVVAVAVRAIVRLVRRTQRGELQSRFFQRRLRAFGMTVLTVAMGYLAAVLAVRGYPLAAIVATVVFLVLIGLAASRRTASHASSR
ncbi:MAG: hypothetical protein EA403_13355 [Spirochaetaceae bacterium]|nr:MAG: hypothetical protein EA403_13355 [Spirochaetaceae bacterium]